MFKSILVLESTWAHDSLDQLSVWPFVSEFANAKNIKAFYKPFSDKAALEHWVEQYNKDPIAGGKLLYIAGHGGKGTISGLKSNINGATIRELLKKYTDIQYVHFGACNFGSQKNLEALLNEVDHLRWAIGYDQRINWIDSTLFDIMVWNRIAARNPYDEDIKGKKSHTLIKELVNNEVDGLAKSLGFSFQYRYGDKVDLVN